MFSLKLPGLRRALVFSSSCILAAASISAPACGQTPSPAAPVDPARIDEVLHSLNRGRTIGQVAVSPDGQRLAWIQGRRDAGDIFVAPINDLAKAERISGGVQPDQHCRENEITWKPNARGLAFF